jgi:DNA-binding winged helix-turn-helix (wHTH) protein
MTQVRKTDTGLTVYRSAETAYVMGKVVAGDCCSVTGPSGIAKSNFFWHLLDPITQRKYLCRIGSTYLFVGVDWQALGEMTERAAWLLLLERLEHSLALPQMKVEKSGPGMRSLSTVVSATSALGDAVSCRLALEARVRSALEAKSTKLVFLCDHFDEGYKHLSPHLFAHLRSLRDEHKYYLSYVVFSREELPQLNSARQCEEFYEIFSANVLRLPPYSYKDARILVERVSARHGQRLAKHVVHQIIALSGGHAGLLKALCMVAVNRTFIPNAFNDTKFAERALNVPDVSVECSKLWTSLNSYDQQSLREICSTERIENPQMIEGFRRLESMHLLNLTEGGVSLFSPLFASYVNRQAAARPQATRIQAGPIRIDTGGDVWVHAKRLSPLTPKELQLLECLCLEPERLRSKEEITAMVYPERCRTGQTVSDDALGALVKRLRERLQEAGGPGWIETVRGRGYRIRVDQDSA